VLQERRWEDAGNSCWRSLVLEITAGERHQLLKQAFYHITSALHQKMPRVHEGVTHFGPRDDFSSGRCLVRLRNGVYHVVVPVMILPPAV